MYSVIPTPIDISKKLANRHKNLRKQLKLSQAEMAERSGVSLGSLKRFESKGEISFVSFLKLAHLLNRLGDFDDVLKPHEDISKIEKLFTSKK